MKNISGIFFYVKSLLSEKKEWELNWELQLEFLFDNQPQAVQLFFNRVLYKSNLFIFLFFFTKIVVDAKNYLTRMSN